MPHPADDNPFEDTKMSFGDHLEELRTALWKAILALVVGFLIGLLLGDDLIRFVQVPLTEGLGELLLKQKQTEYEASLAEGALPNQTLLDEGLAPDVVLISPTELMDRLDQLGVGMQATGELPDRVPLTLWKKIEGAQPIATGVSDGFTVYIKASLVVGAVVSSPFTFYFLWSFIAAGLFPHEKRYVHVFLPFSIGLFLLGSVVAFFFVIQFVLAFLFQFYDWMGISPTPRISEWLSFVLILPLMFGLAFQLPLVMLFLERIRVLSVEAYIKYWRYAVLVIFILSMLLTPADPQSMLLMAGCLTPLYFGGVLLCKFMPRSSASFEETMEENP